MSFAIEVPGEANPLSYQELTRALSLAQSRDNSQRTAAGQQLKVWELLPGYFSGLQTAYLDKSNPYDARLLAIIQLKNGIDRYWRVQQIIKSGLLPEEKNLIRQRLFQGTIDEPDELLTVHNSVVIAKIVRIDYPQEWPDALSSVINLLRASKNGNKRQLDSGLQILLRIVKELGTARMKRSQTALQSVTPEIVYLVGEIYSEKVAVWVDFVKNGRGEEDECKLAMQSSLSALKILRRLLTVGYEFPHHDKTVQEFWTVTQNHFGLMLGFVINNPPVHPDVQQRVGRHLLGFTKLHIDMSEAHAASFVALPNCIPLVHAYWDLVVQFAANFDKSEGIHQLGKVNQWSESERKVDGSLLERLALKGLLLLRVCLRIAFYPKTTFKYRSAEARKEEGEAVALIKEGLLKDEFVLQMANILITKLFFFRAVDMEEWEEDPECWEERESAEGNAYEWEVRPCAERLFLDLLTSYKSLMIPPLLSYFETAKNPQADVIAKESVYATIGLTAPNLVDIFDFDGLLASTIAQDAQGSGPMHKVLRRRIAILLSQWVPVKVADSSRPLIYKIFHHFMNRNDSNNDIVVRMTAARQLRWIVDDLAFDAEQFLPYTADVLRELVELGQIEPDQSKLAVFETMRLLVMRMEDHASQFGDFIMSSIPKLWDGFMVKEYMTKQAIIAVFSALVMSMGNDSQRYQHFMVPLLTEAATPGSETHIHLIDESLELWNSVLIQSNPPLSPEIISIAHLLLPLLEYQSETASQALLAIESYVLLAPEAVLGDSLRQPTLVALSGNMDSKSRERVRVGTVCVEYLIRAASELGGSDGVSVLLKDMLDTSFLYKIFEAIHEAWEAHQTTGPKRKVSRLNTVTEGDYFAILARLVYADPTLFVAMLANFGPLEQVCQWLLGEWFSHLGSMDHIERQKLYLLALTRLMELQHPMQNIVLGKLQDYFSMWTNTISELQDGVVNGADSLIWTQLEPTDYDTPKSIRERELAQKDAVHTVNALDFVKARLQDLVQRVGGEQQFEMEWAVNVDKDLLQKFSALS